MANTNLLKSLVEKEMISTFCQKHQIELLHLSTKQIHSIFNDMEPNLIGYQPCQKALYIGEITTSGFLGQRGRDFHVGAVKKVFEAFSKFYLFHDDAENIIKRTNRHFLEVNIESIKCFFIVPEGSKFINALGYRKRLFDKGYMTLETIELTKDTQDIMIKSLMDSRNENKL